MAVRNHSLATVSVMQPRLVFVIVVSGSGGSAVAGGGANTTVVEETNLIIIICPTCYRPGAGFLVTVMYRSCSTPSR